MFIVNEIVEIQTQTTVDWHKHSITNDFEGWKRLVCQQHQYNFELWHQEDIARSPNVSDAEIATVKRAIDRLNQARNDYIELLDDWITEQIRIRKIAPLIDARQNTETAGSAIDRLSIMALRIFHYEEQLARTDVDEQHQIKVETRLALCQTQRTDLASSLQDLVHDIAAGRKLHKVYRQMKMYNDPTLNPYLYKASNSKTESP